MSAFRKYADWFLQRSRGVRGRLLVNVLLGLVLVGFDLVFVALCKRIIDVASGSFAVADRWTALLWLGGALLGLIPLRLLTGVMVRPPELSRIELTSAPCTITMSFFMGRSKARLLSVLYFGSLGSSSRWKMKLHILLSFSGTSADLAPSAMERMEPLISGML